MLFGYFFRPASFFFLRNKRLCGTEEEEGGGQEPLHNTEWPAALAK